MKKALSIIAVIALVAVLGVALVACVPADPEKAASNLREAGYEVMVTKASDGTGAQLGLNATYEGCVAMIIASKGLLDLDDGVTIFYFNDAEDAKACYEDIKADFDKADDADKEGYKVGKSGKAVYAGSEEAVKAAG